MKVQNKERVRKLEYVAERLFDVESEDEFSCNAVWSHANWQEMRSYAWLMGRREKVTLYRLGKNVHTAEWVGISIQQVLRGHRYRKKTPGGKLRNYRAQELRSWLVLMYAAVVATGDDFLSKPEAEVA